MKALILVALVACGYDRPAALPDDVDAGAAVDAKPALPVAPTALAYESPRVDYLRAAQIFANHPTVIGTVDKYDVQPPLPSGLKLDPVTGAITGAPTADQPALKYTVSAWNAGGHAEATLDIAIDDAAPEALQYVGAPMNLAVAVAMSPQAPSWTMGTPTSFAVQPHLPAGLSLDPYTGQISGTPTVLAAAADYTIRGSNVVGTASVAISIAVTGAPTGLSYDTQAAAYVVGTVIAPNHPHLQSGDASAWSIAPALPGGLALDTATGIIAGTPVTASALASYVVTAKRGTDTTAATLTIRVDAGLVAPAGLAYATNPATYGRGLAIPTNTVASTGGAIASYAISAALPSGLAFDPASGAITGTPTVRQVATPYGVTGTNAVGASSVALQIAVVDLAPSNLVYPTDPASYAKGAAIAPNVPTHAGSPFTACNVSPALPSGLALDATTCAITGVPTAASAAQLYTITAINTGGSTTTTLIVGVVDQAPAALTYARPLATYTLGRAIPPNLPTVTGGAIASWGVVPALPGGLSLDAGGAITGTATGVAAAQTYAITGTNGSGAVTAHLQLQIVAARTIGGELGTGGGGAFACAIVNEGIECWGSNFQGQLGNGTTTDATAPVWVKGMEGATSVRTGGNHTCAILNGEVWCWGANGSGQLGFTGAASAVPLRVLSLPTPVAAIALGDSHTCAAVQGGVWCWGANGHGQLGDGTTTDRAAPRQVTSIASGVRSIAAGGDHTCVQVYGGADCWGSNGNAELGDGTTTDRTTATGVIGMDTGVQAISASAVDTCAIVNGGAWCWGMNAHGALGIGNTNVYSAPVAVAGLGEGVEAIAALFSGACAIANGAVSCWGYNQFGQVGDGTTTDRFAPVATSITGGAQAIGAAGDAACALVDGALRCWGMNTSGQLGLGTLDEKHVPTQVPALAHGVGSLATSGNTTCAVVDGAIDCWGDGEGGLLGIGGVQNAQVPTRVVGITTGAQAVAVSHEHACAIVNGGAQCWGSNATNQLGIVGFGYRTVPTQVQGLARGVQQIATGHGFTCALVDGGVQCWGINTDGQTGNNSTALVPTPVAVNGLGAGVQAIAVGWDHACALRSGIVLCWGANVHGALGNGTTTHGLVPVAVDGIGPGVRGISAGDQQTCATHWGTTTCWGWNQNGQVGDGTIVDRLAPVVVPVAAASVSGAMASCTCVLGGGVKCWGANTDGQLGIAAGEVHVPTALPGFETGVQALSVGQNATCAIVAGGLACLGFNAFGELGDGTTTNRSAPVLVSPL